MSLYSNGRIKNDGMLLSIQFDGGSLNALQPKHGLGKIEFSVFCCVQCWKTKLLYFRPKAVKMF